MTETARNRQSVLKSLPPPDRTGPPTDPTSVPAPASPTTHGRTRNPTTWWLLPLLTSLLLACTVIGLYIGLSRVPVPHQVPVAVVKDRGPAEQVSARTSPALRAHSVSDRNEGLKLLYDGEVAAVLSSSSKGLRLDVAGAAGPTMAASTEQSVARAAAALHRSLSIHDVVPLSTFDRRGHAMFYTGLGIALASTSLAQNLGAARNRSTWSQRMLITGAFSTLSGATAALLAGPLTGGLPGPVWSVALTLALLAAAGALTAQALAAWWGPAGYASATMLFIAVGMSTSGGVVDVGLLPAPAQAVSALLPPGAAVRAIRDVSYFGGHDVSIPLLTLACWVVAGAALLRIRE